MATTLARLLLVLAAAVLLGAAINHLFVSLNDGITRAVQTITH